MAMRWSKVAVGSSISALSVPSGCSRWNEVTSTASLVSPPTPSASASRRAGSMVSTSERCAAAAWWSASTAERVVLPTPPGPRQTTSGASSRSSGEASEGAAFLRETPGLDEPHALGEAGRRGGGGRRGELEAAEDFGRDGAQAVDLRPGARQALSISQRARGGRAGRGLPAVLLGSGRAGADRPSAGGAAGTWLTTTVRLATPMSAGAAHELDGLVDGQLLGQRHGEESASLRVWSAERFDAARPPARSGPTRSIACTDRGVSRSDSAWPVARQVHHRAAALRGRLVSTRSRELVEEEHLANGRRGWMKSFRSGFSRTAPAMPRAGRVSRPSTGTRASRGRGDDPDSAVAGASARPCAGWPTARPRRARRAARGGARRQGRDERALAGAALPGHEHELALFDERSNGSEGGQEVFDSRRGTGIRQGRGHGRGQDARGPGFRATVPGVSEREPVAFG